MDVPIGNVPFPMLFQTLEDAVSLKTMEWSLSFDANIHRVATVNVVVMNASETASTRLNQDRDFPTLQFRLCFY